jgi:dihydroneopterin aldolase
MEQRDRITLRGIEVVARHGVYPQEKRDPQPFRADLLVWLEPRPDLDELATTVDYSGLVDLVAAVLGGDSVDLIETLAERIAAACLSRPGVAEVEVTVHKPDAPLSVPVGDVAVTINRRKP